MCGREYMSLAAYKYSLPWSLRIKPNLPTNQNAKLAVGWTWIWILWSLYCSMNICHEMVYMIFLGMVFEFSLTFKNILVQDLKLFFHLWKLCPSGMIFAKVFYKQVNSSIVWMEVIINSFNCSSLILKY